MGFIMDYAVPAIIGALISIFMDKIVVHYIKVVLRSERMLESLENMVNTLNTVSQNSLHIKEKCVDSLIHGWDERLQELVGEASRMVREHRLVGEHRGFSRVHYTLNILSRYRRSKEIANLISDMSKHLKLVPVVQLECVLSLISNKRSLPIVLLEGSPSDLLGRGDSAAAISILIGGIVVWVITSLFLEIFSCIGRARNFGKKLESFRDLTGKIYPFVIYSQLKIRQIQSLDANQSDNWLTNGGNWVDQMDAIIKEGERIEISRSPIARCKKSEQITELTSRIDAQLDKLSWITLDLLFHEIEGPTGNTVTSPRTLSTSPQETRGSSSDKTEGSTIRPTPPQETEGSTIRPTPPQETRGSSSDETEGSTIRPTPPQETEGSTSHPTPPLQVI